MNDLIKRLRNIAGDVRIYGSPSPKTLADRLDKLCDLIEMEALAAQGLTCAATKTPRQEGPVKSESTWQMGAMAARNGEPASSNPFTPPGGNTFDQLDSEGWDNGWHFAKRQMSRGL